MSLLRSTRDRRRRAERVLAGLRDGVAAAARDRLGIAEGEALVARLDAAHLDVYEPLEALYVERIDPAALLDRLLGIVLDATEERPEPLRALDRRREIDAIWFQRSRMIGYVCYVDRFAGTLSAVEKHLDYLADLGVTYLHLMPLLKPRPGESDGGYAVADYRAVDPRLGTMADLEGLAAALHERGMSLCIDMVVNHTAQEHPWAQAAMGGDERYRRFYRVFPDRTMPDAYEATLPQVFPDTAPGNFTHVSEMGGWVWTTFYEFQWDLDWANPDVFAAMLETLLHLANKGVDVFRLDAVPFMWKRLGTDSQNQPEVHAIVQALRGLVRLAAPGVIFKAEAIVAPEHLVQYLGAHDRYRPECELAYNNQLMVQLWSAAASRDGRLATQALSRLRPVPAPASWVTYIRNHDDIGWAISDEDAGAVGWGGWAHRRFLVDFYAGRFPGSFARGAPFQENPVTGDARTSGTAASLCGIDAALQAGDPAALEAGVRRLLLLHSVIYSFGGIPLIYMGDELALRNDAAWDEEPAHGGDNRWMHRPHMDWDAAARRHEPGTLEHRVFAGLHALGAARRDLLALRAGGTTHLVWTDAPSVLAYRRQHPRSAPFLALINFADWPVTVDRDVPWHAGLGGDPEVVHASDPGLSLGPDRIALPGLGFVWLAAH